MSSQLVDVFFDRALDALPSELSLALRAAGLDDAGILDSYPRDSYDVLVAAGVTGIDIAAGGTLTGTGDDMDVVLAASAGTSYFLSYCPLLSFLLYRLSLRRASFLRCSPVFPSPSLLSGFSSLHEQM